MKNKRLRRVMIRILAVSGILVIGLLLYYFLWFLRQPERNIPDFPGAFLSPANGRIAAVQFWSQDSLTWEKDAGVVQVMTSEVGKQGWLIAIEMDVTHVHYQRAPAAARCIRKNYVKGRFNNALIHTNRFGLRLENERNELLFETADGIRFKMVQVAGLVARRIEDFVSPGQEVRAGEIIGLIKLGSQVAVILPENVKPVVKPDEIVTDGETILAKKA